MDSPTRRSSIPILKQRKNPPTSSIHESSNITPIPITRSANQIPKLDIEDEVTKLIDENRQLKERYDEALGDILKIQCKNDELKKELFTEKLHLKKTSELHLNNVELQLYEANEHISELLEKNNQLMKENLTLKSELAELSSLTNLMHTNIQENLDTSQRFEETFLRVKQERDELVKKQDSTVPLTEEVASLEKGLNQQKKAYEAQFIEYETMEERNNLEIVKRLRESATIQSLLAQVKLLKNELKVFKICEENCQATLSAKVIESDESKPTYKQPPPPPPLPNLLLNCLQNNNTNISEQRLKTFGDAINDAQLKLLHFPTEKLTINATGLAAVIEDLKNGRVTLRRRIYPSTSTPSSPLPTSPTFNRDSIYELVQKNRAQNRISKKINTELSTIFKKFNLF